MGGSPTLNVLFLCTANTARSLIAEALLNHLGDGAFSAFSGGTAPGAEVHPLTLHTLAKNGVPTASLRPKPWQEYTRRSAPPIDTVIFVCKGALGDAPKQIPGDPRAYLCPMPDPALVQGSDQDIRAAFQVTYEIIRVRVQWLIEVRAKNPERGAFLDALAKVPLFTPCD